MEDQHIEITLGKKTLNCLIAETDEEREIGLSQYKGLDKNEGMIFIYEEPQEAVTYTCEEMSFPIDIIFIESLLHRNYKKEVENDIIEEKQEPRNE